ncbi:flagellar basal body P-ring formation chaperone FlgA [Achromobacter xylosoxidans]|uniref:flagellar basal body P-ring formation chaperone FlgA n=2 Tax=Alcaligenes xylosoxydans xylosoxydans TaxID=85698 RepID=UPI00047EEBEA|nr:flagellar basal body P-ring formation chaperone FlgA [Achromobacter xylosoxidans]MCH4594192.1 flagellar basal body P-ring formation chaperone FlgA [Achromobacter xylosoxidans]MCZ8384108.1 flagellar basal body P-ring formation chaperone FlgA [Achromobacter xylosoxidans]
MRKLTFLLILWSCVAAAAPQDSDAVLFLRAQVRVPTAALTLGDVARIEAPAERLPALAGLAIGVVPPAGATREIGREELQRWIDTAEQDLGQVRWRGNNTVRVSRKTAPLDAAAVLKVAEDAARLALQARFDEFSVQAAGNPLPDVVSAGPFEFRARPVAADEALASRLVVWVELWRKGQLYRAVPVALIVRAMAPVLRVNAALPAGASVSMADVTIEQRDVAALAAAYWPADEPLGAVRTRQAVAAGTVLLRSQLDALPDVERGDLVALRVRAGSVTIETSAQAMQDGWINRTLRVLPANATDTIQARVIRGGLVEVVQ